MSQIQQALDGIRAIAFQVSVTVLAKRAGVNEDTARRMLKKPPTQIDNLIALEKAAAALHGEAEAARKIP